MFDWPSFEDTEENPKKTAVKCLIFMLWSYPWIQPLKKLLQQRTHELGENRTNETMVNTRSIPPFLYESQKEFYSLHREFALMVKFPFDPDQEEVRYISACWQTKGLWQPLPKWRQNLRRIKRRHLSLGPRSQKGRWWLPQWRKPLLVKSPRDTVRGV